VDNPVILQIDVKKAMEDGIAINKAGTDVYVVDRVDAKYLSRMDETEEEK